MPRTQASWILALLVVAICPILSRSQELSVMPVEIVNSAAVSSPLLFVDESLTPEGNTVRQVSKLGFGRKNGNAICFTADVIRPSGAVETVETLVFDINSGQLSIGGDYPIYTTPTDNQIANDWSISISANQTSVGALSSANQSLELEFPLFNRTNGIDRVYYWTSSNNSKVYFVNFGQFDTSLTILDVGTKQLYSSIISVPGFNISHGYEQPDPYNIARAQIIEISSGNYLIGFGGIDLVGAFGGTNYNLYSVNETTSDPTQVLTLKQTTNQPGFWPVAYNDQRLATISGIFYEQTTEATLSSLNVNVFDLSTGVMNSQRFSATEPWRLREKYLTIAITVPICVIGGCIVIFVVLITQRRSLKKKCHCNKKKPAAV